MLSQSHKARLLAVAATAFFCLSCAGGGSVAFRQGRKAEARKDWDSALVNFEKAVQNQPENAQYIVHERQARTEASLMHLKNGRRLLKEGRIEEAMGEFQKAASIDPTNQAAAQELSRLVEVQAAAKRARESALKEALKSREEASESPTIQLKPFPKEPLTHFRITADSRKVYETLGKLADFNVAFTSDFQPRPVSVDLSNVHIEDALRIVAFQTKTFWRPITPNTILVVPDTPNNRRDYGEEVVRTVYLSNPLQPADRTAITTALKQVLGLQRIIDNPDANAIIIRDTPAKVAAAERLIHDLDRGKAEILIEVAVVEADRDRIRDLGLSLATVSPTGSISNGLQAGVVFAPPVASTSGGTTTGSAVNLGSLTYRDYAAVLPSATASAVLNDSHTHILQNPQVRVTDGQKASLKIGSKIPYATGSFAPSFGGVTGGTSGGIGLLASTQFQFQDVGVNLELTPHLLPDGEVAIHASIEILSLGAPISIGGISQPTFGQRKIEHDIRLKEGEVNLLGGLIQTTETQQVSGLPGLGDIPLLRYFFSTEHRERAETEVLVMLTPHVIRLPEATVASGTNLPVEESGHPSVPETAQPSEVPPQPPEQPQPQ